MVPVYAAMSYGALVASDYAMYFKTVRDVYEAWVIYNFLSLCLAWVGGPGAVAMSLTGRVLKPSTLLLTCWLPPIPLDGNFIRHCKRGCLQFVFIKPLLAGLCLALYATGLYEEGVFAASNGYPYVTCVYMVSYSLAVYALLFFYFGCHDLLRSFNPIPKFIMIKLVVVLTYWQGIVVFVAGHLGLVRSSTDAADLQSLLLCCEMALAAVGFAWAFPVTPFAAASVGGGGGRIVEEVGGFFQRLRHAAAVGDVVDDTVHQFSPTYHDYVLYSDGSTQAKHFRTRTFVPMGREMEAYRKDGKINSIQSPDYILAPPPPLHPFPCKPCATTTTAPDTTTGSTTTMSSSASGLASDTAIRTLAADSLGTASGDPFREVTNSVGTSGARAAAATVTAPASTMVTELPPGTALLDFLSGSGTKSMVTCQEEAPPGLLYRASIPCGSDQITTLFTSPSDIPGSTQTKSGSSYSSTQTNHGSSYSSSYGDMQGVIRAKGLCGESSREGGRRAGLFERLTDENEYDSAAHGGGGGGGGAGVSGVSRRASSRSGKNETEWRESRSGSRSEGRSGSVHRHSSVSSRSSEGGSERAALYGHHRDSTQGGGIGGKGRRAETGSEGGEAREKENDKEKEKGRRAGLWSARGLVKVLTRGSMDLGLVVDEEDLMEEGDARRELEGVVQR
ncbi:unnamed protein product [Closterium sp. NIES-64]|nr:unnamed protein product [Closterium sp. NIES-64]